MRKLLAHLILMANAKGVSFVDWIRYVWTSLIHFGPIAFLLSTAGWWFADNRQFGLFVSTALILNLIVSGVTHHTNGTFKWKLFLWRNLEMAFVVSIVYLVMEMLRYTVGNNIAGEMFRILIQVMTLLYPISKILKNIFILTKGKYPPEFLMTKLYNFEKNGDLKDFFSTEK